MPKHFEVCGKTFAVQAKAVKIAKVLALECFVLHGVGNIIATQIPMLILILYYILLYVS